MSSYQWRGLIWRERQGDQWSAEARLLAAYLLTGPATNRIGCFAFALDDATRETGLDSNALTTILAGFEQEGFACFDAACGFIWVREVLRRHPFRDSEEVRRALPELASVPRDAPFRPALVQAFRASADRPGAPAAAEQTRFAQVRRQLPGMKLVDSTGFHGQARTLVGVGDYLRRCRGYLLDLVDTRPLRLLGLATIVCAILFVVFPGIDLGVARWFFDPPRSFSLGDSWVGRFFDADIHYAMEWFLLVLVCVFFYGLVRKRVYWGLTPKNFLFVVLSIALGAGLLTNVVLKDSWGRARPSQIVEFGGPKQFSPPFMRSTQCDKNCSFVSGDASLATTYMAFAVIATRNKRRWWAALGIFAAIVGLMRMARGSHFLSDVVFGIIFNLMVVLVLARFIIEGRWRDWPSWRAQASAEATIR